MQAHDQIICLSYDCYFTTPTHFSPTHIFFVLSHLSRCWFV